MPEDFNLRAISMDGAKMASRFARFLSCPIFFVIRIPFLLLLKSVLVCCFVFFHLLICCSSLFHARSSLHPSSGIPLVLVCLPRRTITLWTTAKMDADSQSSFGSLSIRFSVS